MLKARNFREGMGRCCAAKSSNTFFVFKLFTFAKLGVSVKEKGKHFFLFCAVLIAKAVRAMFETLVIVFFEFAKTTFFP